MTITWNDGEGPTLSCPACRDPGPKRTRLTTGSAVPPHQPLLLVCCTRCGSAFFPDTPEAAYEEGAGGKAALAFYLEQGAGIDVMAETLAMIEPGQVSRYLEIGCGFGFSLDFARHAYGWTVQGIDPGSNARAGRDLLALDIRSEYLRSGGDVGPDRPDLILCSEVLEHIDTPDGFLGIMREALTSGGTLLLTTPNAAAITPDTPPGVLVPLLSPGYHLILYSRSGLEAALKRAGFEAVVVQERGATLVAAAGEAGLRLDPDRRLDRAAYRSWLSTRIGTVPATSSLGFGLRYRLFKEMVNSADYGAADVLAAELATACQTGWGLDLDHPETLIDQAAIPDGLGRYQALYPFCLCGILYHQGVLALQNSQDRERARACFLAAAQAGEMLRAVLRAEGMDDGEADLLSWKGRANAAWLLAWSEPAAAAAAAGAFPDTSGPLLKEKAPASIARETVQTILVTLVNLGHYTEAETLAAKVMSPPEEEADAMDAETDFVLGMLDLNHHPAYPAGAERFARAHRISLRLARAGHDAPLLWSSLYHEAFAWLLAADGGKAQDRFKLLLSSSEEQGLPPVPDGLRAQALELVHTHQLTI